MSRKWKYLLVTAAAVTLVGCSVFTGQAGDPFVEVLGGMARDGKISKEVLEAVLAAYRDVLSNSSDPWYATVLSHLASIAGAFLGLKLLPDKLFLNAATLKKLEGKA